VVEAQRVPVVTVAAVDRGQWGEECPVGPGARLLSVNGQPVEALGEAGVGPALFPAVLPPLSAALLEFEVEA
jgi:hypothetical protein